MSSDIARDVRRIRLPRHCQPLGLQDTEVHAILRAAGASTHGLARRNYALVQLMLQTGLRVGEVAALRIGDLTLHDRSGSVHVRHGKGLKDREVPLNATVRRAVKQYLRCASRCRRGRAVVSQWPCRRLAGALDPGGDRRSCRRARLSRIPVSVSHPASYLRPRTICATIPANWSSSPPSSVTTPSTPQLFTRDPHPPTSRRTWSDRISMSMDDDLPPKAARGGGSASRPTPPRTNSPETGV